MTLFEWDPKELSIGIAPMDNDHKILINMMDEIYRMNEQGALFSEIEKKIENFLVFTVKHFNSEERFMESFGYRDLNLHKSIHQELLTKAKNHVEMIKRNQEIPHSFFVFLRTWLTAHIKGIDTRYAAEVINKQKIK